jgi:pyroglutamyl-peptidase
MDAIAVTHPLRRYWIRTMKKQSSQIGVLVTGFSPFGGEAINSSWEVARALNGAVVTAAAPTKRRASATGAQSGARKVGASSAFVTVRQIPCEFDKAREALARYIQRLDPAIIIALGQANTRNDVSVERVAININDARIADNAGAKPIDTAVLAGAPVGYFSRLPIKSIVKAMRQAGIPASVSQTAGTFVCNHLFFGLMHLLATRYPDKRGGFIHLPPLPAQAAALPGTASLARDTMVEAIRVAIAITLAARNDIRVSEGAVD